MNGTWNEPDDSYLDEFVGAVSISPTASILLGTLILPSPQGPPAGYLWDIRAYQIVGATARSSPTLTGTIDIFIGIPPTTTAYDVGLCWVDSTGSCSLPLDETFSRHQRVVRSGQAIWAVVSGTLAGEEYIFKGQVEVEPA